MPPSDGRPRMGAEVVARYKGTDSQTARTLTAAATVRLDEGPPLRATALPDARLRATGSADRTLEHHLVFSPADSAHIAAATDNGEKPRLVARVTDRQGESTLAATQAGAAQVESASTVAERNEGQPQKTPQKFGETYGPPGSTNACDDYGQGCQNIQGWSWAAENFMASHTQQMGDCPGNLIYVDDGETNVWASVDTSDSKHFSGISLGTSITVTDWNPRGHPYHYTIYYACAPPD